MVDEDIQKLQAKIELLEKEIFEIKNELYTFRNYVIPKLGVVYSCI